MEIEIEDITSTGEGVGNLDGLKVFVDGALPGELVEVARTTLKKTFAKASLLKIIKQSPDRVTPICPIFSKCGGCQLMHLSYEAGLKLKEKRIRDAFERIGKLENFALMPCHPSPSELHYRNKIQLPISQDRSIGLYAKRSHEIIPVEHCFIHHPAGESVFQACSKIIRDSSITIYNEQNGKGELRHLLLKSGNGVLVVLITTKKPTYNLKGIAKQIIAQEGVVGVIHGLNQKRSNVVRGDHYTLLEGEYYLMAELLGIKVRLSAPSFFQVNSSQAANIYEKALELADLKPSDRVIDAYCGVGLFACLLAKKCDHVTGIEVVSEAIEDANYNAKLNGVEVDFVCGKVEDLIDQYPRQTVVFINPPRKGCAEKVLVNIAKMNPKKIIYTSCDPATLARDLNILSTLGYSKIEAYPFDMFPQTTHVEILTIISKAMF